MPSNDVVLVDSLIEKAFAESEAPRDPGFEFAWFSAEQVLKPYNLSYEEQESGIVDAGDDGGIDGFYVLLNGRLLTEVLPDEELPRQPRMEVVIVTAKRSASFAQAPLTSLCSSLPELFDFGKTDDELIVPFEEGILDIREVFRSNYISLAGLRPTLAIRIFYASRGDTNRIAPNVRARGNQLKQAVRKLFGDTCVEVDFLGAAELLDAARTQPTHSLALRFIESTISRESGNYLLLAKLTDYVAFVTDEKGELRQYLFESNIRDYLGGTPVNRDILQALGRSDKEVDFWWLNNGITLLASHAVVAGKQLSLENVQIVNGLQTTESIYRHFRSQKDVTQEDRAILIKIVVTDDNEVRDRIIKASNYQTAVSLASLRGTEKLQRDIEHFLADYGWHYDRRINYWKNKGVARERIVSMSYLGACVVAIALRDPGRARTMRTRYLRNDERYAEIFSAAYPLELYLKCLEAVKTVETLTRKEQDRLPFQISRLAIGKPRDPRLLIAYVLTSRTIGKCDYSIEEFLKADLEIVAADVVSVCASIHQCASQFTARHGRERSRGVGKLFRNEGFVSSLLSSLAE